MSEPTEVPKCWICLCGPDEPPPLGTMKDAVDFVHPCSCSLQAHRRCLLDWISTKDIKIKVGGNATIDGNNNDNQNDNANEGGNEVDAIIDDNNNNNNNNENFIVNNRLNVSGIVLGLLRSVVDLFDLRLDNKPAIIADVTCPQCQAPIFISIPANKLITISSVSKLVARQLVKYGILWGIISSIATGLAVGTFVTLSQMGTNVLHTIVPQSVQPKLFGIRSFSYHSITRGNGLFGGYNYNNNYGLSGLDGWKAALVPMIPIYMLGLRATPGTSYIVEALIHAFPHLSYLSDNTNAGSSHYQPPTLQQLFNSRDPRFWLLLASPVRTLYNMFFNLTLNRVYYRWVTQVRPCFIADRVSALELKEIEDDNREAQELQAEHERGLLLSRNRTINDNDNTNNEVANKVENEARKPTSVISALFHKITQLFKSSTTVLSETDPRKQLARRRRRREFKAAMKNDYSNVFRYESRFLTLLTTMAWPHLAKLISLRLLSKIASLANLGRTPDELEFLRNLIAMVIVVVLKDVANLFMVWLKVRQLKNVQILEFDTEEWAKAMKQKL